MILGIVDLLIKLKIAFIQGCGVRVGVTRSRGNEPEVGV